MRTRTIVAAGTALILAVGRLTAQDPFEIIVYPAATAAPGEWELETHLNYTARGTTAFDGSVAPASWDDVELNRSREGRPGEPHVG
jgi:hypothetical protein